MFASVEEIVSFIRRAEYEFNRRMNLQNNNDVFQSSFETVSSDIQSQGDNLDILAEVSYFTTFNVS